MSFPHRSAWPALALGFALALALAATAAGAQVTDKKVLTLDGARRVIAAAVVEARKDAGTGVIAVVDDGGNLMALERLDGTFAAGARISTGKARTAALFRRPTRAFEEVIGKGRTAMVALDDFTPLQGGVPITVDGQVVGAIGVSGAMSAQRDEEIALAGAATLGGPMPMALPPAMPMPMEHGAVQFFGHEQVAAAFAKGAVLVDGSGGRNYMVHASRREGAGQAEVHARDTDLIYVLSGSATFVTGGTVVEPKETAPDEVRGARIDGGETRQLVPGDVLVVPSGVPHWFREVPGPLTYYVVKVR
jgi:glc operon protein GlcG